MSKYMPSIPNWGMKERAKGAYNWATADRGVVKGIKSVPGNVASGFQQSVSNVGSRIKSDFVEIPNEFKIKKPNVDPINKTATVEGTLVLPNGASIEIIGNARINPAAGATAGGRRRRRHTKRSRRGGRGGRRQRHTRRRRSN